MEGTLRTYNEETRQLVKSKIRKICEGIASGFDCQVDVDLSDMYPPVINHESQTNHVIEVAKTWFGDSHFSQDNLPSSAAEDFSYYLQERPGCFFTLGTWKVNEHPKICHSSVFDYNDDMIASAAYLFIRLVEHRLDVKIF